MMTGGCFFMKIWYGDSALEKVIRKESQAAARRAIAELSA